MIGPDEHHDNVTDSTYTVRPGGRSAGARVYDTDQLHLECDKSYTCGHMKLTSHFSYNDVYTPKFVYSV